MFNTTIKTTLFNLIITSLLFLYSYAGTIQPYGLSFIDASIANKGQNADYVFNFIPETIVPAGGTLRVVFPTQYVSGLGLNGNPTCTPSCTVNGYTVDFTLTEELPNTTPSSVRVNQVMNPLTKGGTGNFKLYTMKGVNVLDENLIFDVIGIADSVGTLTSTLVTTDAAGIDNAGETTRYNFQFRVSQLIPATSYMRFTIQDANFQMTRFPACSAFAVNGKIVQGRFVCEAIGQNIFVYGLGVDIPAAQDVGISVAMINPTYAGITNTFTIAVLRSGTKMIYDVATAIPGVRISAGVISEISMTPVNSWMIASRKKMMDYIVNFKLKNGLNSDGWISLAFPPSFQVVSTATNPPMYAYIIEGLEDINQDSTVKMVVDGVNNIITITNFVSFVEPQLISLYLRLVNPDNVGETTPVNIRSYVDPLFTVLVDEDTSSAFTTVQDVSSPGTHQITTPTAAANTLITTIEFQITTSITVPAGGCVKIRVPDGFAIGTILNTQCLATDSTMTYLSSAACSNIGNTIIITLPGTVSFPLLVARKFLLSSIITTPVLNGTFLFDVTTYLNDQITVIESYTDYFTVTPSPFTAYSLVSIEKLQGRYTVLTATFTTSFIIPAGSNQDKASDVKGFLEFEFLSGYGINVDLGIGATGKTLIACNPEAGLVPIDTDIECFLIPGTPKPTPVAATALINPIIRVENFQQIAAGTVISVSFPEIINPAGVTTFSIKMKTIQLVDRVRTEYNSITLGLTNTASAATLVDGVNSSPYAYNFTSTYVSTLTSLTFNPNILVSLTGPGTFIIVLPFYDIGWIPDPDGITCLLGTTVYSCTRYSSADWITIRLASGSTFASNTSITINNLMVPRYANTNPTGLTIAYNPDSVYQRTVYKIMNPFPVASIPTFAQATLIADKKNQGAVDCTYSLVFVPPNNIPQGASIIISFPDGYNLLTSNPPVTFSSPDLIPYSGTKVSFGSSIARVTVTNFRTQAALSTFTIIVDGVKNPSGMTYSSMWNAEVKYGGYQMVLHYNFDQFVFTPTLGTSLITFNQIEAFPLNADEDAHYLIDFVPSTEIPVGGLVKITFPSDSYSDLPNPPDCKVYGGITTFSSCTLSATSYTIVLDSKYSGGGIIVQIRNIRNPDRGTTSGFIVQTSYDGVVLDYTDLTSLTGRTLTLVDSGDNVIVKSLSFDPQNEGEQSTYTFKFLPTNPVESIMNIVIWFPDVYDKNLGDNVQCAATSGLIGTISCSVSERLVTLTGFDTYLPDAERPITINVYGVVNPNTDVATGQFRVGTLYTGHLYFTDLNSYFGSLQTLNAPGWAVLYDIEAENLQARLEADYTFNFTGVAQIPKTSSKGAILVDFPIEFEIPDGDINCDAITTSFSPIITCSFSRNRMIIQGQTQDYSGNVKFIVRNIENPIDSGTSKNIVLKTYDGINYRIIERSFKNLDPFVFSYNYPGPLIKVNNDQIINTIAGTQTQELFITIDSPCALNLTLKPYTPGFSIIPYGVKLSLGQVKSGFRLSVPMSFPEGTYEIEWETQGDIIPAYYTPIRKTTVKVVAQTGLRITLPTLNYIPYGGNSLPSAFTIVNGPDIGIEITVNFLISYPGITVNSTTCTFEAGQTSSAFTIYSSSNTTITGGTKIEKGTVLISLTGINQDIYTLPANSFEFKLTDTDLSLPNVNVFYVSSIAQTTASIYLATNEVVMVYYMIALNGTIQPSFLEVRNQGPVPNITTNSMYGFAQIDASLATTISFNTLVAETPYVFYAYLVDRGDNQLPVISLNFQTLDRYNAADFSLKFLQEYLNEAEKEIVISSISFILGLYNHKLQEKKYETSSSRLLRESSHNSADGSTEYEGARILLDPTDNSAVPVQKKNNSRVLQEEIFMFMNLQIAAVPESAIYPAPKTLALSLNDKKALILARLPNIDPNYTVEAFEFVRYTPSFPSLPVLKTTDSRWATFRGKLNNYGWIFVSCVQLNESYGIPTPYQIKNGFDNRNFAMPSGAVEVSEPYASFEVNITGLFPLTDYIAYIIGGSSHFGYPDLMSADNVVQIPFRTEVIEQRAKLVHKGARVHEVACSVMVAMVSIFVFW